LKRNTSDVVELELVEDFVGCEEAKDSARSVVQRVFDGCELRLSDLAEIHSFGQVFTDQAIGVLVGATLPRTVRIAEEDIHAQPLGQCFVPGHLAALVVGECLAQAGRHAT